MVAKSKGISKIVRPSGVARAGAKIVKSTGAKAQGNAKAGKSRGVSTKHAPTKKIRIGILVGKDFDPVKKGTQWPDFPSRYVLTEDDWGKYSVDVGTALKMQQLHPDILDIDIIPGKDISQKRLQKNHVNLNFWYDVGVAMMHGGKKHIAEVMRCHKNPDCRLDPSWDYYDWVLCKPRYMEQCKKAGIPTIPTVVYKNGFEPKQCLKDVQKLGWDKFFVKVGHFSFFGEGAVHGKTEDFLGKRAKDLEEYAKANKKSQVFLLQPYTLKPNGEVFDEVRNFFIDGQWRYSVFTHGTDETDAGYYEEPEGPRKAACKALAEKVYQEVLKAATWQGKRQTPLLNRIDIGVIPKKGGESLHKTDNAYFLNEVELIMTTWLDRYSPISVQDVMAQASVKHALELLAGMLNAKVRVPDEASVRKAVEVLNGRLGPFQHVKVRA
uniref:ATP-grasp domain-containing protein n=1 Tax=Alexandrium monilatum TaxID=311494 RepID=A0A7S4T0F9_9DINO